MEGPITSAKNPKVKELLSLQEKPKTRREKGLFVVEGRRELEHCLAARHRYTAAASPVRLIPYGHIKCLLRCQMHYVTPARLIPCLGVMAVSAAHVASLHE